MEETLRLVLVFEALFMASGKNGKVAADEESHHHHLVAAA